ncbi:type IV pilin protein [Pseudoxanthomonas spadix]|uniref:type IV pilin protein n=2 Tax=Pseudoxanthomonas spadix TaxID=415229 RepID=UPI003CCDA1E8
MIDAKENTDMKHRCPVRRHGHVAGFTLIELMIVVAIIAILAAIALASYQSQVVKSRRAAAASCLQQGAQFMERYYTINLSYANAPRPDCDADVRAHYAQPDFVGTPAAKTYTLQIVPTGAQASKDTLCGTLSINQQGVRGEGGTATAADQCW